MNPGKILGIFKKGAKATSKKKGKKGDEKTYAWPSGIKVGIYGHSNSGKTVYYTVLNEECKISKDLQISVMDGSTASEFLTNYRSLWGLGMASEAGTMVDFRGEKKFPDPTAGDKVLQFNAILDHSHKLSIVAYDYNGKAVSISEKHELDEKVHDFMASSDGLLFFFDPKVMGAELQTQACVAAFVNMLERLAPLSSRLPVPIALVITKADILPGFTENQAVLVNPAEEHIISEDFELFLEKVLSSNKIASNPAWAGSVRNILVKLREFLRIVVGRTLNFQIFFLSNTGDPPEKIGTEVGRSIYTPPAKIRPIGVKEPFYWLLNAIIRNRRLKRFRKLAKYVTVISILWMLLYSLPFLYHFKIALPKPVKLENRILKTHDGSHLSTSENERRTIMSA